MRSESTANRSCRWRFADGIRRISRLPVRGRHSICNLAETEEQLKTVEAGLRPDGISLGACEAFPYDVKAWRNQWQGRPLLTDIRSSLVRPFVDPGQRIAFALPGKSVLRAMSSPASNSARSMS